METDKILQGPIRMDRFPTAAAMTVDLPDDRELARRIGKRKLRQLQKDADRGVRQFHTREDVVAYFTDCGYTPEELDRLLTIAYRWAAEKRDELDGMLSQLSDHATS
jgi:hypothetical protein